MFTFNGVHSSAYNINVNHPTISGMTYFENYLEAMDEKDGVVDFGIIYKERYITFNCNFPPQISNSAMMTIIDNINKAFNPKLGLKSFIFDHSPDRQAYARLYVGIDIQKVIRTGGQFTLTFIFPNPYSYALTPSNEQFTTNGIHTFTVNGTTTAKPILTIIADIQQGGDNLVFNFNNTHVLELKSIIETTYELIIDCENKKITYKNISTAIEQNGLPFIDKLSFPELLNGLNSLEITESSSLTTITSIDIDYYDRYL